MIRPFLRRLNSLKPAKAMRILFTALVKSNQRVFTLCLLYLAGLTTAQATIYNLCTSRFEVALAPQCFKPFGVDFQGLLFVFNRNRTGAIPSGYTFQTFVDFLCSTQMQDNVISCVLKLMQRHSRAQCSTRDRLGVFSKGHQMTAFFDTTCRKQCEQAARQTLKQCFAAINANPDPILNQKASITADKFTVIGTTQSDYDNFCKNRQKLFSCLNPLSNTCPSLLQRLYTHWVNVEAMANATDILCADRAQYFQALQCFSNKRPALLRCGRRTETAVRKVRSGRYQTGDIPPSQYMDELCKSKLLQIYCELWGYSKLCSEENIKLRRSVECASLPEPCRIVRIRPQKHMSPLRKRLKVDIRFLFKVNCGKN
ncbi:hypothetical protein PoB_001386600 [Plakobranchus ocellatus]|uniref:Uncharacterized protein n=1 Tax=Plakobranchus ocellatus TaxID=259542 RepID=A0AAV3YV96_9GAST|nr:hypothetical protein PoB_001386600 [Plakobranchus ocellatus]